MTNTYRKFTALLDDFLTEALAEENLSVFLLSLKDVIRVHGTLSALAEKAHISRGTLYNLFSKKANPEMKTVMTVLNYLGYSLKVTKKHEPLHTPRKKTSSSRRRSRCKTLLRKK